MSFLNRRLCISALSSDARLSLIEHQAPGTGHMASLSNDHLLVTMLLDSCEADDAPTLLEALSLGKRTQLFRSTERLAPCPEIYDATRVCHAVELDLEFGKPGGWQFQSSLPSPCSPSGRPGAVGSPVALCPKYSGFQYQTRP